MKEFRTVCVLGRLPALSLAELESLYGSDDIEKFGKHALLKTPAFEIEFKRLGGSLKIAQILAELESTKWPAIEKFLLKNVPGHVKNTPEGKFTLGISAYGLDVEPESIQKTGLKLKKIIKASGRPVRVVPNKEPSLNSAQVLHNRLIHKGAWELVVISNGTRTYLAQTVFVQDVGAYGARDQARPKRDSLVGMLPPKLAQTIINLSVGINSGKIYDPFCGTGVVLQEALLMGFDVLGSDISARMVEYSKENLTWLESSHPEIKSRYEVSVHDATKLFSNYSFEYVASEIYLGPVLKGRVDSNSVKSAIEETDKVLEGFLKAMAESDVKQLCLAVPCWDLNGQFIHLPTLDRLSVLGYNRLSFVHTVWEELIYHRPGQAVARELLVLKKV